MAGVSEARRPVPQRGKARKIRASPARPSTLPLRLLAAMSVTSPSRDTPKGNIKPGADAPAPGAAGPDELRVRKLVMHGHAMAYRQAGSGPVVVLLHGITSNSATWSRVMPYLARRFTVIAPDLIGHGESAKPRGDYSLGAHACGLRDLLLALGHDRATIVGHSLGGGIAMQFSYQFPERCERLVLVDSGGLGRDVSPLLRAATLPGSEFVLPLLVATRLLDAGALAGRLLNRLGLRARTDLAEIARGHASLSDAEARSAFIHTLRSVVEPGGQRVDASNRLYLAEHLPFLLAWGARDPIIPVSHARAAHEQVRGSRLEVFADSGHFPQLDEPQRFVEVLVDFIDSTEPAALQADRWRRLLELA
jgi:pimeloyl-ACP methyl ester carboxylesterase